MIHTLEQCNGAHCKCMGGDCTNYHYADCETCPKNMPIKTGYVGEFNGIVRDESPIFKVSIKNKLLDVLKNPNNKLIAVDLDGTLCTGEFWGETEPEPITDMIDLVWEWYKKGAHIIIYTARQPKYFEQTNAWLIKYSVPFHGIAMQQKIGADVYIDDKALNPEDMNFI